MPPSEGQESRALAQAIEGRKCAETGKVHSDARIVYKHAYGAPACVAGWFHVAGNYTTRIRRPAPTRLGVLLSAVDS